MAGEDSTNVSTQDAADKGAAVDPRDTDHPTGSEQAAENAENDPPA